MFISTIHRIVISLLAAAILFPLIGWAQTRRAQTPSGKPNIVVILADDLGYGDLSSYRATKVRTANLDRLAKEGRRFTDAHSPSSVCSPTRYGLLTGRYSWRTSLASGVLNFNAPLQSSRAG